jgi:hypothetical protein
MLKAVSGITRAQAAAFSQAPVAAQEWMAPPNINGAPGAVTANLLYAAPWIAGQTCLVDQIATRVTTGAAGNVKLGLYSAAGNLPGSLLAENTADLTTASAAVVIGTIAATQVVAGQQYWITACFSGAPTMFCYNTAAYGGGYFWATGSLRNLPDPLLLGGAFFLNRALTYVSGPTPFFPATFGAPTVTGLVCPLFAVRRAA